MGAEEFEEALLVGGADEEGEEPVSRSTTGGEDPFTLDTVACWEEEVLESRASRLEALLLVEEGADLLDRGEGDRRPDGRGTAKF